MSNTVQFQHRMSRELVERIRRRFRNPLTQRTVYGEIGRVGESLWRAWLEEQERTGAAPIALGEEQDDAAD